MSQAKKEKEIIYCGHPSKEWLEFRSMTEKLVSSMNDLKVTDSSMIMEQLEDLKKTLDETSAKVKEKIEFLNENASKDVQPSSSPLLWCFDDRHGENIELKEERTFAERTKNYRNAVVISEMPMDIDRCYTVKVESMKDGGSQYLAVGVTWTDPKTKDNDDKNASIASKLKDSLIINSSNITLCKDPSEKPSSVRSSYGKALKSIKEESMVAIKEESMVAIKEESMVAIKEESMVAIKEERMVAIKIDYQNCLHLYIDGKEGEDDGGIRVYRFISPCWAVFDVRGKCKSIRIVP